MHGRIVLSRGRPILGCPDGLIEVRLLPPLFAHRERGAPVQLGVELGQLIARDPVPVLLRHEFDDLPDCQCAATTHLRATDI